MNTIRQSLEIWGKIFKLLWLYIYNFIADIWYSITTFSFNMSLRLDNISFNPLNIIKKITFNPLNFIRNISFDLLDRLSNIDFSSLILLSKLFISIPKYIFIKIFNFIVKVSIPFLINNIAYTIFITVVFLLVSYYMYKKKSWYYFKSFKLIRFIIKIFTLPIYALVVLNYNIIISMFNLTIRSYITSMWNNKFEEYKKKRKDKYFAYLGSVFIFILFVVFSGIFDRMFYFINKYIYNYRSAFDDVFYYLYIYNDYIEVIRNIFIFNLFFVPIEKFLFQNIFVNIDLQPPLLVKKFLRWVARIQGKTYVGTVSNKVKKEFKTKNPFKKHIFISDKQRALHTDVVGTTGTGKSASMIFPWLFSDLKRGRGGIVIDAKGDLEFFDKIYSYKERKTNNDSSIKLINLADKSFSNSYNPILRGNSIEIKDRIMDSFKWANEYYKTQAEKTLIILIKATKNIDKKITFHDLYVLLTDVKAVRALKEKVTSNVIKNQINTEILYDFKKVREDTSGLRNNIYMLAYGDGNSEGLDEVINTYNPDIDLLECYKNNEIVYITLPTNLIGQTARAFGKMLLMDLKSTGGYIQQEQLDKKFYPVFIDEFSEFATEEFVGWLNKARSSGFRIHIAHQSLGDLEQVNDSFVKQVVDNTNIKMVFRINDSDSVENYCSQLGTFKTTKETERVSKNLITQEEDTVGSLRETDEFIVSPNTIKNLNQGQAMLFGRHPKSFQTIINTDYLPDIETVNVELVKTDNKFDGLNIDKIKENHLKQKNKNSLDKINKIEKNNDSNKNKLKKDDANKDKKDNSNIFELKNYKNHKNKEKKKNNIKNDEKNNKDMQKENCKDNNNKKEDNKEEFDDFI